MMSDVAIIGAGAVGCAVARRFALEGAKVLLLEKAPDILSGASKGNSAILHTGFDAQIGSLELACVQAGYVEYLDIRKRMNLPILETGAMVVAWTKAELAALERIAVQAHTNGVSDVHYLTAQEALAREPTLSSHLCGALLVAHEHVIDPWSPFLAYVLQALAHGAQVVFRAGVIGGSFDDHCWRLTTTKGEFSAHMVINCAGLYGDQIDRMLLGKCEFEIRPRKGQFVVFDKAAARLVRTIILPVPTERTKGVVLAPTIFGNVLVGPTAEDQKDRARANVDTETLHGLVARAVEIVPELADVSVTACYAGLRPATDLNCYRISADPVHNWITVGGIRSTGMTAALGIAGHVYNLYHKSGRRHTPVVNPTWPTVPNLAEHRTRDWQRANHGGIVCHCELVTRREIEQALAGLLPAGDFGGLRRRTRCAMGRCQGFGCSAKLADITAGRFATPLAVGTVT